MSDKTFDEKFIELLKTHKDFVDDTGELLRERIKRQAYDLNKDLITLLLSDDTVATEFFEEIAGRWIFNNNKFIAYLNDVNFLDKSYTRFKNKIGLNVDGKYLQERGEVALVWPYKDCVLEGGQATEQQKQDEIFFNEILAPDEINQMFEPKVLTNWKRYTVDGEQDLTELQRDENGTIRENLIIKGNNLIALHTLKRQFKEQVKLIYIDPPYNTGNDSFGYNNSFNHSTWLTFKKNRLEAAKYFLSNNGSIWISIDERELAYLKVLCDEIFGRENHISTITVKVKDPAGVGQQAPIFDICEYLLVYAKDIKQFKENLPEFFETSPFTEKAKGYKNLILDYGNPKLVKEIERKNVGLVKIYECEDYEISNANKLPFDEYVKKRDSIAADYNPSGGMILAIRGEFPKKGLSYIEYTPTKGRMAGKLSKVYFMNRRILSFLSEILIEIEDDMYRKTKLTNLWDIPNASLHLEGGIEFKNGKKPEELIKKILSFCTFEGDLIMDFNVGSGTTGAVAHKMNRQWITIEQMDYVEIKAVKRLKNVIAGEQRGISKSVKWQGGGDFIYCELKAYNETYMERIQSAESTEQLLEIWREMPRKSILNWYINPKAPEQAEEEFIKIDDLDKQKQELMKQLDKNQLYVNLSEITDEAYEVSESDKQLNTDFYATKGDDESDA